jgi:hypothetical protein
MVAGKALTPDEQRDVRRLKRYWAYGEGRQKWVNNPHPYTALVNQLRKYMGENDKMLKGYAAEVFHMALGFWPGTPHKGTTPTPGAKRD